MPANQGSANAPGSMKCGHAACQCTVKPGQRYCSDYCDSTAKSSKTVSGKCGCGHASCSGKR